MAKARYKKQKLHLTPARAPQHGDLLTVTRMIATGEAVSYQAYLHVTEGGRTMLERVRGSAVTRRSVEVRELFVASVDLPVAGYRGWFIISGLAVLLSRHTSEVFLRCMTGILYRQNAVASD